MNKLSKILFSTLMSTFIAFPASAGLIGLYEFNDAGDLGKDSSGNGNHASNVGSTYSALGFEGGAAVFNGGSYLRSPINPNVSVLAKMTWGAWVKPSATNGIRTVLSADNGSYDRGINIDSRRGGTWSVFTGSGIHASGVAPSTTDWTFLAAVYDQTSNSMTLYVDNQSFTTGTAFGGSHTIFDIGHNPSFGEFFQGSIDNVFVYDEALTSGQIATIQADGFSTTNAVPAPAVTWLTIAGLGLLAGQRRRRISLAP